MCDHNLRDSQDRLTEALREAVRKGQTGELWEGGFPRYVWARLDGTVHEARLINRERGQYKGYPLTDDEVGELGV